MLPAGGHTYVDTIVAMISFPAPTPGVPVRVSATSYVAYRRCPDSARARLEGSYPPDTVPSFTGALVHRLIRRHLVDGVIPDRELVQACREEIGAGLNEKMVALGIRSPSLLQPIIEQAGALYRRFRSLPGEGFEGAEIDLYSEPAPGVELVGKVDAIFRDGDAARLVDWKSGGLGDPHDQLAFYAMLWALAREEVPAVVEAVSIQTGERTEAHLTRSTLEGVASTVSELVSAIRRAWADGDDLRTIAGPWCRYCPVLETCAEGSAAIGLLDGIRPDPQPT